MTRRAAAEVEVRREQRRVARPEPAVQRPRVAVERRREPPREVRLVDVAAGDPLADRLDARPRRPRDRATSGRRAPSDRASATGRRLARGPRRDRVAARRRRSRTSARRPASRVRVAVERAPGQPRRAGPAVPGDRPVVEGEPEERQALVVRGRRRQALEDVAELVGEEADEPAEERRRGRRPPPCRQRPSSAAEPRSSSRRATANGSPPAAGSVRTATGSAVR